ncbi:hypothetical protein ACQB60_07240 [Actinomycetota bacterium Odt1-20B]
MAERTGLAVFAGELADRLPGTWAAAVNEHTSHADQFQVAERVWSRGTVGCVFDEFAVNRHAVLTSDSHTHLVVIDRPQRTREFLVAALEPRGSGFAALGLAPDGIAVSGDPVRAASRVERRLLPRYEQVLRDVLIDRLAGAVRTGERVLADWDAVSDSLCDAEGWPLDDRYGLRQQQRDADMWAQFAPFLDHGPALVDHAEQTLPLFTAADRAAGRWPSRLHTLREALRGGAEVESLHQEAVQAILPDHPRSAETYANAIALRNAEGWHYSLTWMDNASVLVEMAHAEKELPTPSSRPAGRVQGPSARTEAARAWSPYALRVINAAIEETVLGSPPMRPFNSARPPRSR